MVFKTFFLLDAAPGRLLNKPSLEACLLGKRAAVMYSQNDVLGALARDEGGDYEFEVTPGGERQRELAIRLARQHRDVRALPRLQGRRRAPAAHHERA